MVVGVVEAAAVKWLIDTLRGESEAYGRSRIAEFFKGDPFENALSSALTEALFAAVEYLIEDPTEEKVGGVVAVFDAVWPSVELDGLSLELGWLDRIHAASSAAIEAGQAPHGIEDADADTGRSSSWEALVDDYGIDVMPDAFAEVLAAAFVKSVEAGAIRPGSALAGLSSALGKEIDARQDAARFRSLVGEFGDVKVAIATITSGMAALPEATAAAVGRELANVASISRWHAASELGSGFSNVPRRFGAVFVGRLEEFAALVEGVGNTSIVGQAVDGPGGIGKTRLALEYARDCQRQGWEVVWWIDAGVDDDGERQGGGGEILTRGRIVDGLGALGRRLGIERDDRLEAADAVLRNLERREDRWLVVYDNVEHPHALNELVPLLTSTGQVLVTSRAQGWPSVGMQPVSLGQLDDDAAIELLASLLHADASDPGEIRRLAVDVLGGHALAITQAGAHIGTNLVSIAGYIDRLTTVDVDAMFGTERLGDYDRTVATVYGATLAALDASAVELLGRLAWLHPDGVHKSIVNALGHRMGHRSSRPTRPLPAHRTHSSRNVDASRHPAPDPTTAT